MPDPTPLADYALLRAYVATGDQPAFSELVRRHVHLVYATARRQLPGRTTAQST